MIGRGRAVEIDELLLLQRRDLHEEARLRTRFGLALCAPAIRREQIVPVGDLLREILEARLGVTVFGRELQHLAVIAAGLLGVVEATARDLREVTEQLEARGLGQRAAIDRALECSDNFAPLVGLVREPRQVAVELLAARIEIKRAHREASQGGAGFIVE